jgi:molybdopterin synthase catalytic subunit
VLVPRLQIASAPLSLEALTTVVVDDSSGPVGAVSSFIGLVRGENVGRRVSFLEYEAYESLALKMLARIEQEARVEWPSATLGIHHRTGRLDVGDASVAIVAASAHRSDAFAVCRYAIERVKQILPVWKHEHFDGGDTWVEGATADPDDETARLEARRRACA